MVCSQVGKAFDFELKSVGSSPTIPEALLAEW